eukprot:TRINITY_DN1967_c0_g1_i2.p1 TRINITY_DN1967_c0_g1~~TRINITY_DN1967_c0_g1_i2.p1  ORF type:complete len:138 (-),score=31.07 TRINITY_DN1967_c0_g1_i2:129-542(-)
MDREQLKQLFSSFDVDNSGSISLGEFVQILRSAGFSDEETAEMVKMADSGGDGSIDFDEFVKLMGNEATTDDSELKSYFEMLDVDGSGFINESELLEGLKQMGQDLTKEQLDELLKDLDKDGDGKINYREFVKLLSQ